MRKTTTFPIFARFFAFNLFFLLFSTTNPAMAANAGNGDDDYGFIYNDFNTAQQKAFAEGKLIIVDFVASWCTQCRVMDEYTFPNRSVSEFLKNDAVLLKVNIDDPAGYRLKTQYNIQVLPTVMVLNSKGQTLAKHEQTLNATELLAVMNRHNSPDNRLKNPQLTGRQGNNSNLVRPDEGRYTPVRVYNEPVRPQLVSLKGKVNTAPQPSIQAEEEQGFDENGYQQDPRKSKKASKAKQSQPSKPALVAQKGGTVNRVTTTNRDLPNTGYTVQIGCWKDEMNYKKNLDRVKNLNLKEKCYAYRTADPNDGEASYRILLGNFEKNEEARRLMYNLRESGFENAFSRPFNNLPRSTPPPSGGKR